MKKTAIILSGGKSLRMKEDKAFVKWINGKTLIENQISELNFFDELIISGPKDKYEFFNVKVIEDENKNIGPLEGLRRGLIFSNSDYNFLISCDIPFINKDLIEYMFSIAQNYDAVVCRNGQYIEPIYSIYSKNIVPVIEKNIFLHKLSFRDLIYSVNTFFISEKLVRQFSADLSVFYNINTKKDLLKFLYK